MNKHTFRLVNDMVRQRAVQAIMAAPNGWIVEAKEPTRSTVQNAKMWAMLADVARAQPDGRQATPEVWKALFMNAMGFECAFETGLDGRPFPTGFRTSRLTVSQMRDMIEFIYAYGAQHGVRWSEPNPIEQAS